MDGFQRLFVVLAAALAVASTSAVAADVLEKTDRAASKAVQMSDAQLDEITAAGALTFLILANPGKASVFEPIPPGSHGRCINCGVISGNGRASGVVLVQNRGHPAGFFRCVGSCPIGLPF